MRVGLMHYTGPPVVGGVEQTMAHHARHLVAAGHEPILIVGDGSSQRPGVEVRRVPLIASRHPDVLAVKTELDRGQVSARFEDLAHRLQEEVAAATGDLGGLIVHNALSLHKNLALTAALRELQRRATWPRLIAWHHDLSWDRPDYAAELHPGDPWDLIRRPWPGVTHVTVSRQQQERLARLMDLPLESIVVVPPGVDPGEHYRWGPTTRRLYDELHLEAAGLILLLPTRVTRRKNIELAIAIVASLIADSGLDVRLLVTGPPGPHNPANAVYLDELIGLSRRLGVDHAVHFLHRIGPPPAPDLDDATVAELFTVADALLFPSRSEGFGIPVLEAGLARLPAFVSSIPALRESGEDDVTYLDLADAPEASARRIRTALEANAAFRLRRRVLRDYSWARIVRGRLLPLLGVDAG
jgi:glycosyltransferase involved in cell wall biosynthesis